MDLHQCLGQVVTELATTVDRIDNAAAEGLIQEILDAERIFVAGAGRSGLIMRGFAMRLMHLEFGAHVVGYVTTPAIGPGDLLLIGSASGATASLRSFAATAQRLGARAALITAQASSPLAQQADCTVVLPAPTPKADVAEAVTSIQPMASLFEQTMLVLLDSLSLLIMQRRGQDDAAAFRHHANLE